MPAIFRYEIIRSRRARWPALRIHEVSFPIRLTLAAKLRSNENILKDEWICLPAAEAAAGRHGRREGLR